MQGCGIRATRVKGLGFRAPEKFGIEGVGCIVSSTDIRTIEEHRVPWGSNFLSFGTNLVRERVLATQTSTLNPKKP